MWRGCYKTLWWKVYQVALTLAFVSAFEAEDIALRVGLHALASFSTDQVVVEIDPLCQ